MEYDSHSFEIQTEETMEYICFLPLIRIVKAESRNTLDPRNMSKPGYKQLLRNVASVYLMILIIWKPDYLHWIGV